jgi:ABC-type multidrug transport system fused ATPase/permease subunit
MIRSLGALLKGQKILNRSVFNSLGTLLKALRPRRRKQLILLLGLMFVAALAEMLSIGAILPFLAVLAEPQQAQQMPIMKFLMKVLMLEPGNNLRWQMTAMFGGAIVFAGVVRFLLIYASARFNFSVGHELSSELYRRTLYQPYEEHTSRNSSEIQAGISKVDVVTDLFYNILLFFSASLMVVFVVAALLAIDPAVATAALLGVGIIYAGVLLQARKPLAANSAILQGAYSSRIQSVNEGLGGIRDVLLDRSQELFVQRFSLIDWAFRRAQASNQILYFGPRLLVESLGMLLIVGLAYWLTVQERMGSSLVGAIPVLGALALGAQRLMPQLQNLYLGWSSVVSKKGILEDVAKMIEESAGPPVEQSGRTLSFTDTIRFQKVSFSYGSGGSDVLHDIDLCIGKGQRIGLIGNTGGGKSTAIDLLMGLLEPTRGQIRVDGVPLIGRARLEWQAHIGHVSQSIYLADCSLAENIAFGRDPTLIDHQRIRAAAHQAQIAGYIETLPAQYETQVGERGVRLSGGQRQRIGIARALYKNADVLVFDEATSALDSATEQAIMKAIANLSKDITVVQAAHRISTLRNCDLILELRDGYLLRSCRYEDLVASVVEQPSEVLTRVIRPEITP